MNRIKAAALLLALACLVGSRAFGGAPLTIDEQRLYSRYLSDTLASLDAMRGRTGLVKDSVWVCSDPTSGKPHLKDVEPLTSPTNIGLDLLILTQRARTGTPAEQAAAKATLTRVMATLGRMPIYPATGLFFRTYWPDTGLPEDLSLSSVDNLHLAFGLWVVAETFAPSDPATAGEARRLFERMDFSAFYNETTGLIGGNMRPTAGGYKRDTFDYKYFGSEARSLYTLGFALGLYKEASRRIPHFDDKLLGEGIAAMTAETAAGPLLRAWDGSAFQLLLPAVLVREDRYSPLLAVMHRNYAKRLLQEAKTLGVPAAHSASAFGVKGLRLFRSGDAEFDRHLPIYNGKSGHVDLVATMNQDLKKDDTRPYWDIVYTPHPAFMAASLARNTATDAAFASLFRQNETLQSPASCTCREGAGALACTCASSSDLPNWPAGSQEAAHEPNLCTVAKAPLPIPGQDHLYRSGLGWMDGYYVGGPFKGRVVPVLISLDQAMIALSLASLLAPDGETAATRALNGNKTVHERLQKAYGKVDAKLRGILGLAH